MELRVLEYFLAVARKESISKAAESLHLSQPTLSLSLFSSSDKFNLRYAKSFSFYYYFSAIHQAF